MITWKEIRRDAGKLFDAYREAFARGMTLDRFIRSQNRERRSRRPRKPAPKHRAALLEKKAEAQGWGGRQGDEDV